MRSRIWAIAVNTFRQALRLRVAIVFIVLLFAGLFAIGFISIGDGTLKGRLQAFVSYSLSLESVLLCSLTIVLSVYCLTHDIKNRQLYTVITKPVRRFELVLGKFLGVVALNAVLLVLASAVIYGITVYIPRYLHVTSADLQKLKARYPENKAEDAAKDPQIAILAEQIAVLNNEFFTARASVLPVNEDPDKKDVEDTYKKYYQSGQLAEFFPGYSYEQIIITITNWKRLEKRTVPVAGELVWEFQNIKPASSQQSLFMRFKYTASPQPPNSVVCGTWIIGDTRRDAFGPKERTPVYVTDRKDAVNTVHEIEIPANAIAKDGYLAVTFGNPPFMADMQFGNDCVVTFPLENKVELLYKTGTFTGNFIKSVILVLFQIIFLACLGCLAAVFLSFPVAILFCFVIFAVSSVSGFVVESIDTLGQNAGFIYHYTVKQVIRLLPSFDAVTPSTFLVPARELPWMLLAEVALFTVCIKAMILLCLAIIIFIYKEIAKVIV